MKYPSIERHSLHFQDFRPDDLLEAVRGADFEHYILANTRCDARLERWSCNGLSVDVGRYSFPVRAMGAFSSGKLCVGYMRHATQPTWVNGFAADQRTLEFYPAGIDLNYRAAPDGEWVAIQFDEIALQAAAQKCLGHPVDLPWKHVASFCVRRNERAEIDRMVRSLWTHPVSGSLMIEPILGCIAVLLHNVQRRSSGLLADRDLQRLETLQRADNFLRANLSEPFDLQALADTTGASPRSLQRYFLQAYGLTPLEWARCQSLHHVRRRLRASHLKKFTIESAARECGFRHMGRFSIHYRELFGESPMETLRVAA